MIAYIDLHIHSCLSPCGDSLMTPNNIVNMSMLKGLDIIAVTDHNSARNLPAVKRVCDETGIQLLPGMELTTQEEVHLLAYFPTVEAACGFSDEIHGHLPPIKNRADIFGEQQVMDEEDEQIAEEELLLLSALDLSIDRLVDMIHAEGGLAVPAHINRGSNGLLNALGFLPPTLPIDAVEVARGMPCAADVSRLRVLHSSDAHYIENILEAEVGLALPAKTTEAVFAWIQSGEKQF